ncbi:MAG: GNAT family N-acetyltransferase [Anaerolineaceae bacterium]|nr:GNAT family N-acetyltransferase [Anaerolineaceae bacterium]
MNHGLFKGNLVDLVPMDLDKDPEILSKWDCDSEFKRQFDVVPAVMYSPILSKEWYEAASANGATMIIQTTKEKKVIGIIELDGFDWAARSAWVGIGIGEADYRGKGYGTEAMQLILEYAFQGLNLNRVNLNVFAFNTRAIRSYEKCGFRYEGTQREVIYKEDQRWDVIDMGILRSEWEERQKIWEREPVELVQAAS